jgi:hypothetical protein
MMGIFKVFPMLSYDEDDAVAEALATTEGDGGTNTSQNAINQVLYDFQQQFLSIKSKWTKAFQDIEGTHLLVTADIAKLVEPTQQLLLCIGSSELSDGSHMSLKENIRSLASSLQSQITDQSHQVGLTLTSFSK